MSELWPRFPLEALVDKVGSGSTPKGGESVYKLSGTPLIRSMNVVFFGFKRNGLAYLDEIQAEALKNAEVKAEDVLLNITGASIGRVTLAPQEAEGARVNQHVCIIRPNAALAPRFLNAYLSSPEMQDRIWADNYGVTRQALTKQQILGFNIPLPPIPEQKRIADKLDSVLARVDACRDRLDRFPALLKRFRQSILAAATSGRLTTDFPRENGNKLAVPLQQSLTSIRTGPFGSSLHKSDYILGGIPIVNPMHIQQGKIVPTLGMSVNNATASRLSDFRLSKGDVIIGRRGEMGRCAVVTVEQSDWLCGTGSMVLKPNDGLDPCYLQLFLSSPATIRALEGESVGTTMVNLNQKILLALEIYYPPIEEQTEIVRRVELLFAFADRLEARLATARRQVGQLTPALLAKAFRGELVAQDPADEPATELLKRLAAQRAEAPKAKRGRAKA
jgi:type I restriction enzyme S subunit